MFTSQQYRAKAIEYGNLVVGSTNSNERREYRQLQRKFSELADNEQGLPDKHYHTLHAPMTEQSSGVILAGEEENIQRYLGAALIMQWNTLPTKLQRELFDNAGCMGELLDTATLRGQIARFLHKHKDAEETAANIRTEATYSGTGPPAAAIAGGTTREALAKRPSNQGHGKTKNTGVACG
jgi:hypothetical protein